jgi:hypothetical protein
MQSFPNEERRAISDRRHMATSVWATLVGRGRRMFQRRWREHKRAYFVDRFSPSTLVVILTLLFLSIVDALITIHLLPSGCGEVNPLMARLLDWGVLPFLVGKYILTAAGLPVLLVFKNFTLFGTRFRVGYLIPTLVALYVLLVVYQVALLSMHVGF